MLAGFDVRWQQGIDRGSMGEQFLQNCSKEETHFYTRIAIFNSLLMAFLFTFVQ